VGGQRICDATVVLFGPLQISPDASTLLLPLTSDGGSGCQYDEAERKADGQVGQLYEIDEMGNYRVQVSHPGYTSTATDFSVGYYTEGCDPTPAPKRVNVMLVAQ
jgi:hypothetical protein